MPISVPTTVLWADSRARSRSTTAGGPATPGFAFADAARALRILRASEAARLDALEHTTDLVEYEKVGAARNSRQLLEEIDAALRRIDDGSYGVCHGCGGVIAVARLHALPYTRFCELCG